MKKFLVFKTNVYKAEEYNKYFKSVDPENEIEAIYQANGIKTLPKRMKASIAIDPTKIVSYIETFSIEESEEEHPIFDTVDVELESGATYQLYTTFDEFTEKLKEFRESNS